MKTGKTPSKPAALFLCVGPERRLRSDAIRQLRSQFLAPGFEAMDEVIFSEPPEDGRPILEALKTSPFGPKQRLVIVDRLDSLEPEHLSWIQEYLKASPPRSSLVLCVDELDRPSERFFAQQPAGLVEKILCQPLKGERLSGWLIQEAQSKGKKLAPGALNLLTARVGTRLESLGLALETLALLAGSDPQITPAHVEALIQPSVKETAFDILDSAAAGEPQKAIALLRQALGVGALSIEQFMGALGWYYRMAWKAKKSPGSESFSWSSPGRQAALQRLKRWPDSKLEEALEDLLKADVGLKLSTPAPEALADQLLLRLGS